MIKIFNLKKQLIKTKILKIQTNNFRKKTKKIINFQMKIKRKFEMKILVRKNLEKVDKFSVMN